MIIAGMTSQKQLTFFHEVVEVWGCRCKLFLPYVVYQRSIIEGVDHSEHTHRFHRQPHNVSPCSGSIRFTISSMQLDGGLLTHTHAAWWLVNEASVVDASVE